MPQKDLLHWPALLQCVGSDELTVFHSESEWDDYAPIALGQSHSEDRLIDSLGRCFRVDDAALSECGQCDLSEVISLIRAHLADQGHCCVTKFGARSVADAIDMLAAMPD